MHGRAYISMVIGPFWFKYASIFCSIYVNFIISVFGRLVAYVRRIARTVHVLLTEFTIFVSIRVIMKIKRQKTVIMFPVTFNTNLELYLGSSRKLYSPKSYNILFIFWLVVRYWSRSPIMLFKNTNWLFTLSKVKVSLKIW